MTNFSFALLAILCAGSLALSFFAARFAVRRTASPLAKQASIESKLRLIDSSLSELQETVSQLANKVKMQRVRTAINHSSDPEPELSGKDALRRRAGLVAGQPAPHR